MVSLSYKSVVLYVFDAANIKWYLSESLFSRMYVTMYVRIICMKFTDTMKNYTFGSDMWFNTNSELTCMDYKIFLKISKSFKY